MNNRRTFHAAKNSTTADAAKTKPLHPVNDDDTKVADGLLDPEPIESVLVSSKLHDFSDLEKKAKVNSDVELIKSGERKVVVKFSYVNSMNGVVRCDDATKAVLGSLASGDSDGTIYGAFVVYDRDGKFVHEATKEEREAAGFHYPVKKK